MRHPTKCEETRAFPDTRLFLNLEKQPSATTVRAAWISYRTRFTPRCQRHVLPTATVRCSCSYPDASSVFVLVLYSSDASVLLQQTGDGAFQQRHTGGVNQQLYLRPSTASLSRRVKVSFVRLCSLWLSQRRSSQAHDEATVMEGPSTLDAAVLPRVGDLHLGSVLRVMDHVAFHQMGIQTLHCT